MIDTISLKRKVVDLAINGSLTEHLHGDAIEELSSIIEKHKNSSQRIIIESEKWIDVPSNWTWARLKDLTTNDTLNDGDWVLSKDMVQDGPVKLIQLGSIGDCKYRFKGFKYLTEEHFHELNGKQIFPGYLLINRLVVDRMLSCIIPELKGILMTAVDVCWVAPNDELYDLKYLMYALSSTGVQQKVQELGHGVTRFRISKLNLIDIAFPLPPIEEQHVIVNKIEEIFELLDKIDILQSQYQNDVDVLKSKIIDAGIRGQLTEQLPEDGTAEDLYQAIQTEKAQLIKDKKIKKEKPLPKITTDEIPFEIPENWKWVRLGEIVTVYGGKRIPAGRQLTSIDTGHKYIRVSDMKDQTVMTDNLLFVPEDIYPKVSKYVINKDDVYITVAGTIGKVGKIPPDIDGSNLTENADRLVFSKLAQDWLIFCLSSNVVQRQISSYITQVAQPKLAIKRIQEFYVPLPPLAEQKRIVAQIDEVLNALND